MSDIPSTPWHKTSFDRFLHQTLSELLVDRLHLDGYRVDCSGNYACGITLSGGPAGDPFEVTYPSLPAPDDSGVFRLDPAWELGEVNLTLTHLGSGVGGSRATRSFGMGGHGQLLPVTGRPGTWTFDMGRVPAGRYHVEVFRVGYQASVEVPLAGTDDLEIRIGAPSTIVARIEDRPDGTISEARALNWWMPPPADYHQFRAIRVNHEQGRTVSEFRVPPGRIALEVVSIWHAGETQVVEVQPGQRLDVTLPVTPSGRVAIVLREGQARVPVDEDWVQEVRAVEGSGESCLWAHREGAYCIWVTEPGHYRVTFHDIPGYAPVEPREVDIEAGKSTPLEIQLTPK
jgi:hypothetical protein